MNHKDILPEFFLNSLIHEFNGIYDLSKLNRNKTIFQDKNIIEIGFLR